MKRITIAIVVSLVFLGSCVDKGLEMSTNSKVLIAKIDTLKPENLAYYETPGFLDPCFHILEKTKGQNYEQKELHMLSKVPRKLGYYYLIFRYDALWGNGGTQAVALDVGLEENKALLSR